MVRLDGEKMSKSRGNLVFVSRLRNAGTDPAAIRLAILAHHYRGDWDWTDSVLAEAETRLAAWRSAVDAPMACRLDRCSTACVPTSPTTSTLRALSLRSTAAEETRLRGGAAGAEDLGAGALVRDIAAALLGVAL